MHVGEKQKTREKIDKNKSTTRIDKSKLNLVDINLNMVEKYAKLLGYESLEY